VGSSAPDTATHERPDETIDHATHSSSPRGGGGHTKNKQTDTQTDTRSKETEYNALMEEKTLFATLPPPSVTPGTLTTHCGQEKGRRRHGERGRGDTGEETPPTTTNATPRHQQMEN
jgi:hypothetical protein